MSGVYIGIDGKARKIKGGYIGIDGKARKIKKGYIGVDGVARLCWSAVDPVFANNSWETIVLACQTGTVPDSWQVGDQKTMTINGVDYPIDIIGKNHDDYSDGSGKAPLTFQLHDCYKTKYNIHSNMVSAIAWKDTSMRTKHLPNIMAVMPSEVQRAIKPVNKTSYGGITSDTLFLLSEREVFGTKSHSSTENEGTQYEYYENGGSKIKKINAIADIWWERSKAGIGNCYCLISDKGEPSYATIVSTYGVSFAFCF